MPFERSLWESRASEVDYYCGTAADAQPLAYLLPGIYVLHGCQPEGMRERLAYGWRPLVTLVELGFEAPLGAELPPSPREVMVIPGTSSGGLDARTCQTLAAAAPVWFGGEGVTENRLYRSLPEPVAQRLMTDWVTNSLTTRARRTGLIMRHHIPAGFVTVMGDDRHERIDLLGVAPDYRFRGYGKALARWAVRTRQAPVLTVRTELQNQAAIRVYMAAGFEPVKIDSLWWARVEPAAVPDGWDADPFVLEEEHR